MQLHFPFSGLRRVEDHDPTWPMHGVDCVADPVDVDPARCEAL